jgi:hypothetical protein
VRKRIELIEPLLQALLVIGSQLFETWIVLQRLFLFCRRLVPVLLDPVAEMRPILILLMLLVLLLLVSVVLVVLPVIAALGEGRHRQRRCQESRHRNCFKPLHDAP